MIGKLSLFAIRLGMIACLVLGFGCIDPKLGVLVGFLFFINMF